MSRRWNEIAPLPIRLVFGGGIMLHGYPKLFTADGYDNIVYIVQHICERVRPPAPSLMAFLVALLEFFGGLALVTGTLVGTFSILFIIELTGRLLMQVICGSVPAPLIAAQHLPTVESTFMYLAASIALLFGGSGGYSVTRMFVPRPSD